MQTEIIKLNSLANTPKNDTVAGAEKVTPESVKGCVYAEDVCARIRAAAVALRQGELVAFPTETVYGLGANALLAEAVQAVFAVKGRPQDNPLIVHLTSLAQLAEVAVAVPDTLEILYQAFCPGPLTFVLPRNPQVPAVVSAGLDTVAVRFPAQAACRFFLQEAAVPVVAPSANLSGKPSPTCAEHVMQDFTGKIPYILDDGATELGVESTVLDLTVTPPRILRPGVISAAMIAEQTGIVVEPFAPRAADATMPVRSPGMKYRHYAPQAEVEIVMPQAGQPLAETFLREISHNLRRPLGVFVQEDVWKQLVPETVEEERILPYAFSSVEPVAAAAKELFAALRYFDEAGVKTILAEGFLPAAANEAEAYMDRLTRAASPESSARVKKEVLFLCTGNICRSPMAEIMFNALSQREKAAKTEWRAVSAGLATRDGRKISQPAELALQDLGLTGRYHLSQNLSRAMADRADLIVAMTKQHRNYVLAVWPDLAEKIVLLGEYGAIYRDIDDPYGASVAVYRSIRRQMEPLLQQLAEELLQSD